MKKTKILVPAMAVLALGMAAAVTGTVAWFSANNIVYSNGMQFKSVTPSSLAIGKELTASGIGNATSISWDNPAQELNPCSHWHGVEANNWAGAEDETKALYTVANGEYIDPDSGLAMLSDGNDANPVNTAFNTYENIRFMSASGNLYYVDYTAYIASVGKAITLGTGGYLRATPTFSFTDGDHSDTINAATVDFLVYKLCSTSADGAESYFQGVNAIGKDYRSARHATYVGEVDTVGTTAKEYSDILAPGDRIPTANGTEAIKVVMRFYFDGALLKDASHTYVATNSLDTSNVTVNVSFALNRGTQA